MKGAAIVVLALTACKARMSDEDCLAQAAALKARIARDSQQIATKDALDIAIGLARDELTIATGEATFEPGLVLWFDRTSAPIVEALVTAHACSEPEAPLRLYLLAPDPSLVQGSVAWIDAAARAWKKSFDVRVVVRAETPAPMFPAPQRVNDATSCKAIDDDLAWQRTRMVDTDLRWQRLVAGQIVDTVVPLVCNGPVEPLVVSMHAAWEGDGPGEALHGVLESMFAQVTACRTSVPLAHDEIRELVASPKDGKLVLVQRGATDRFSDCLGTIDRPLDGIVEQPKGETRIQLYVPRG